MLYPLDFKESADATLLFWIERFVKYKLTYLSNRHITDKERFASVMHLLTRGCSSLEELSKLVKEARNAGLIGINTYYKPLEKLFLYLHTFGFASMKEIDEELIADFLASQTGGLSDATKKNYRISLIGFFGFIDKQNGDDEGNSHLFRIELKKWGGITGQSGTKLPAYLSEDEIDRFLRAIDTYPFRPDVSARNKLLVKLIIYTGIRIGEALGIKTKDILSEQGIYTVKIIGKGNKYRVVMIRPEHIDGYLHEWLSQKPETDYLFCNKKARPLTQAYASRIVEDILTSAGIRKEKNGAHMLRHSFATLLYRRKKDLILVQEALGHASVNTSRIYTHFDTDRLMEAVKIMDGLGEE